LIRLLNQRNIWYTLTDTEKVNRFNGATKSTLSDSTNILVTCLELFIKIRPVDVEPFKKQIINILCVLSKSYRLWSRPVELFLEADSIQQYVEDGRKKSTRNKRCQEWNTRKTTTKKKNLNRIAPKFFKVHHGTCFKDTTQNVCSFH
jgi:hypothetical protein